jgi:predicted O-methyltransferase YrrM
MATSNIIMSDFNFHQTQLFKNLWNNDYGYTADARPISGLCLIHYLIRYFKSSSILEIGYKEGTTFMAMIEASAEDACLTAVDISLDMTHYEKHYHHHIKNKQVSLVETPSQLFMAEGIYDFVNIDGNHSYPQTLIDIAVIKDHIDKNTILMIDDYFWDDVDIAIEDFIKLELGFVPFLINSPAIFFHHETHDAAKFLDEILPTYFYDLATQHNVQYKDHTTSVLEFWPSIKSDTKMFSLICKRLTM